MMYASSWAIEKWASVGSASPAGTSSYVYGTPLTEKSLAPIGTRT